MAQQEQQNNYYAFISYSRLDIKAAKFIQKGLENFKYTVFPVADEFKPQNPTFLRRVFRDKTDMDYSNEDYRKVLKKTLDRSRYLVVICSPNAKASAPVHEEIEDFLSHPDHSEADIIPVILKGSLREDKPEENPMPLLLNKTVFTMRNLPVMQPEIGETEHEAWEGALMGIIAYMTKVDRRHIHDRFLRDKRKRALRLFQTSLAVAACMAGLTVWAFYERNRAETARAHAEEAQARAEAQERKSMALFEAGKDFSNDVIFDFNDKLADLKNASALQQELMNSADNYLNRLEKQAVGDAGLTRLVMVAKGQLGDVAVKRGNTDDAYGLYSQGLEIARKLTASDPGNALWQHDLSVLYEKLGDIYRAQGDLSKAKDMYSQGLEIRRKLTASDLGNAEWQRDLSVSYNNLGNIYAAQGDLSKAKDMYSQGLEIRRKLTASDPGNAEWQRDLSVSYDRLGIVYEAQGDLSKAQDMYSQGLETRRKLTTRAPGNMQWQNDLCISYYLCANVFEQQKDIEKATAYFTQALNIAEKVHQTVPDVVKYKQVLDIIKADLKRLKAIKK